MPLSEKIRLDAGRPYIQTLLARIYVSFVLVVLTIVVVHRNDGISIKYNNEFGQKQNIQKEYHVNGNYDNILIVKR